MAKPWGDALVPWLVFGTPAVLFALMWYLLRQKSSNGEASAREGHPSTEHEEASLDRDGETRKGTSHSDAED